MSSYVQVYVKLSCEKSFNAIDMVSEYGNIDEIVVVGDYDDTTKAEFENKNEDFCNDFRYISDDEWSEEVEHGTLPQASFDGSSISYEELLEVHKTGELDSYFT